MRRIALSIACLVGLVNPSFAMGLDELVEKTMSSGADATLPGIAAEKTLGLPNRDFHLKQLSAEREESRDEYGRLFSVVLGEDSRPANLWCYSLKKWPANSLSYNYLLGLDGSLLKATRNKSRTDEKGKVIKGSAVLKDMDIDDADTKAKFQKELNFWLKGIGRKKKAAEAKPQAVPAEKAATASPGR